MTSKILKVLEEDLVRIQELSLPACFFDLDSNLNRWSLLLEPPLCLSRPALDKFPLEQISLRLDLCNMLLWPGLIHFIGLHFSLNVRLRKACSQKTRRNG